MTVYFALLALSANQIVHLRIYPLPKKIIPWFNPLPNDLSKWKAFADDKFNLAKKLKFLLDRVEDIVGKGENAGYWQFLLFPRCFQKLSILGLLKVVFVW